jgi:glycerol-3-phosphate acyltransferase PlsY
MAFVPLLVAFALGSIPTALWWGKARGIDLRQVGSGNLGATNVYRALGPRAGLIVLAIDMLKGAAAVLVAPWLPGGEAMRGWPVAVAAILGHALSPLAGFRGGKGVATGAGSMLAIAPAATIIAVLVFVLTVTITRYVSLGSILAALTLPLAARFLSPQVPGLMWGALVLAVIVIARHRQNIARLIRGTENRFSVAPSRQGGGR